MGGAAVNRAAVLLGPGSLVLEDRPVPEPGPGEALVRVLYAGICGTDLAIHSGDYRVPLPIVLGHEFSGEVIAWGAPGNRPGQLVTAEINNSCLSYGRGDSCPACRAGIPTHCTLRTTLGIDRYDGAFQQYVKIPSGNLHPLPDGLEPRLGVFVEPLAAALQTFELTPIGRDDTVVVLGAGRLGLLVIGVARTRGARVLAVSLRPEELTRARAFGADETFVAGAPGLAEEVRARTQGLGAAVVVEATGSPEGLRTALSLVAPRGTIALKSTPGTSVDGLDATKIAVDEVRIQGSRCGPFAKAIDLVRSKALPVADLIGSVHPLSRIEAAFAAARKETKVIVDCGG
jgi:threonine dehydrogenase-like Zn-dependent dehydrogenase